MVFWGDIENNIGNADNSEKKGVTEKGVCKVMKTKGREIPVRVRECEQGRRFDVGWERRGDSSRG
jgi:hypothetical protein